MIKLKLLLFTVLLVVSESYAQEVSDLAYRTWISIDTYHCSAGKKLRGNEVVNIKMKFFDTKKAGVLAYLSSENEMNILKNNDYHQLNYKIVNNQIFLGSNKYEIISVCHDTLKLIFREMNPCVKVILLEEYAYRRRFDEVIFPQEKEKFLNNYFINEGKDTIRYYNTYFTPELTVPFKVDRKSLNSIRRSIGRHASSDYKYVIRLVVRDDGTLNLVDAYSENPIPQLDELVRNVIEKSSADWNPVAIDGRAVHCMIKFDFFIDLYTGFILLGKYPYYQ